MMTKEQHIEYWIKSAESDLEAIEALFEANKFIHALFFAHLVLEK
jgi:HEPN domain-containing protein